METLSLHPPKRHANKLLCESLDGKRDEAQNEHYISKSQYCI